MTQEVHPSFGRTPRSREIATILAEAGGVTDHYVIPATERLVEASSGNVTSGPLGAFAHASTAGLDVTLDTGEAVVKGGYCVRDTQTTLTLPANATTDIYLGWKDGASDTVLIGDNATASVGDDITSGDHVSRVWSFTTDGATVTSKTDHRVTNRRNAFDFVSTDYVQTTKPAYEQGATWLDPSSGVYSVGYDAGGGGDYYSVPPVRVLNEATSFAESGVSVYRTETMVDSGSIKLHPDLPLQDYEDGNTTIDTPGWNYQEISAPGTVVNSNTMYGSYYLQYQEANSSGSIEYSPSTKLKCDSIKVTYWIEKDVANDFDGCNVEVHDGGGPFALLAFEDSTTDIDLIHGDGSGGNVTTNLGSWLAKSLYDIEFRPNWSTKQFQLLINGTDYGSFNMKVEADGSGLKRMELQNDTNSSGATRILGIDNVEVVGAATSGNALIDFGAPTDIESWDLATFQRTLANETVTVDVEDGAGNVLYSDIGPNFDISTVATSKNVRLRANLSRANTANDPTLDYAARRYVR